MNDGPATLMGSDQITGTPAPADEKLATVGRSVPRKDGVAKVTGKARYTDDFTLPGMRIAKYLRSTIAHGRVTKIDTSRARQLPGVDGVFTFADVPKTPFPTCGHPHSLDPEHQDVADRLLLTDTVRYMGDEIAVVVAEDELTARRALSLIDVAYEAFKPLVRPEDAQAKGARTIHGGSGNRLKEHSVTAGEDVGRARRASDRLFRGTYNTQVVQHCHLENHIAYAYMDDMERITVVSSTQIPHIARRVVGQALRMPWGRIRVVKPHVGGGFGNKQDVILEPMVAFLTKALGGVPVKLSLDRDEGMVGTRVRHPFHATVEMGVKEDGTVNFVDMDVVANTGAYASHGHSIVTVGAIVLHYLLPRASYACRASTIYSNMPAAGAMRGYGCPQSNWIMDCMMEDAARGLGVDPVEFRIQNVVRSGDRNAWSGKHILATGLVEALKKGKELIRWDEKRARWPRKQTGALRRGLGVASFGYVGGTYPATVEIASARLALNQDGSVHLQVGATEIGQGSDTALAQIAAEVLDLGCDKVHVVSTQDTDVTPFDTGAYASRQNFVSGQAVKRAALKLRAKIVDFAAQLTGQASQNLDIAADHIVFQGRPAYRLISLEELAMRSYYDKHIGGQLTGEDSFKARTNSPSLGCTFVDLEVDIPLCKVKINEIYNVHGAGKVINPSLAEGQVHGGMSMSIGAALYEELMVDPDSGRIYNNNLLDYKIPTIMDMPDLGAAFVERYDPTSAFGNKSIGEPPTCSPAPAIRNAILDATGVAINDMPMSPKKLFTHFKAAGLL